MPSQTEHPAQIEGEFTVEVETAHGAPFGETLEFEASSKTLELFPQRDEIVLHLSLSEETTISMDLEPRDALELAKKLMAMCEGYEDIGACDPCGELYPMEELNDLQTSVGDTTACTRCMESGSV